LEDLLNNADVVARFVAVGDFESMEKYVLARASEEDRWVILNADIPPADPVPPDDGEEVAAYLLFRNTAPA